MEPKLSHVNSILFLNTPYNSGSKY